MNKRFDPIRCKESIERGWRELQARTNNFDHPLYLPDGRHSVRPFSDPSGKFYAKSQHYHKIVHAKTLCRGKDCEICALATATRNWKLKPRHMMIFYMAVISTSTSSENWQTGAVGPVLVGQKLGHIIADYIDELGDCDAHIVSGWFAPAQDGRLFLINGGKVCAPGPSGFPITLGIWHKPFEEVWPIPDTNESYFTVLAEAKVACGHFR